MNVEAKHRGPHPQSLLIKEKSRMWVRTESSTVRVKTGENMLNSIPVLLPEVTKETGWKPKEIRSSHKPVSSAKVNCKTSRKINLTKNVNNRNSKFSQKKTPPPLIPSFYFNNCEGKGLCEYSWKCQYLKTISEIMNKPLNSWVITFIEITQFVFK